MLFTTFPQFIALLILFLAGLFIGLGLHPGGAKWKTRYKDESDNYASFRREADKAQRDSNQRIAALEADLAKANERLAQRTDAPAGLRKDGVDDGRRIDPNTVTTTTPVAASAARPAVDRDDRDLTRIRGIDAPLARKLNDLGVTQFEDIESFTPQDEMALEERLSLPAGYITRENWREQAHLLRTGRHEEHADRFLGR